MFIIWKFWNSENKYLKTLHFTLIILNSFTPIIWWFFHNRRVSSIPFFLKKIGDSERDFSKNVKEWYWMIDGDGWCLMVVEDYLLVLEGALNRPILGSLVKQENGHINCVWIGCTMNTTRAQISFDFGGFIAQSHVFKISSFSRVLRAERPEASFCTERTLLGWWEVCFWGLQWSYTLPFLSACWGWFLKEPRTPSRSTFLCRCRAWAQERDRLRKVWWGKDYLCTLDFRVKRDVFSALSV